MIDKGVFRSDERLELLGGELVVREPHGGPHAFAIELAHKALRTAFGPEWRVRVLLPVALDEESEPEPDVSVAQGPLRHGSEPKPSRLALVVEGGGAALDPIDGVELVARFSVEGVIVGDDRTFDSATCFSVVSAVVGAPARA